MISAVGIPGVVGGAPQTAGLLFGLLGHPPISVCLSLVPAPKAHNPPDMGSVQTAQRVCAQPGRTHSLSEEREAGRREPLGAMAGGRKRKREPEAFPVRRPQTWTNPGGDLDQEARLTKEPDCLQKPGGNMRPELDPEPDGEQSRIWCPGGQSKLSRLGGNFQKFEKCLVHPALGPPWIDLAVDKCVDSRRGRGEEMSMCLCCSPGLRLPGSGVVGG